MSVVPSAQISTAPTQKVIIIGNPNTGKSLFFNRLTGLTHKVANYPGITTEVSSGASSDLSNLYYVDFPGIYSLNPLTKDEEVAVSLFHSSLKEADVKSVICVLDATRLERSLLLALQARELCRKLKKPILFIANMMDEVQSFQLEINLEGLAKELQAPVIGVSAKTGAGLDQFFIKVKEVLKAPESFMTQSLLKVNEDAGVIKTEAHRIASLYAAENSELLKKQNKLDRFFLSSIFGGVSFFVIMLFLFQSIFSWAAPVMDLVENSLSFISESLGGFIAEGVILDFLRDAIIGGLGSFLIFVPQIFILTFLIGVLEDSGYLARAAILCHRPLSFFGLSGRSFVPLLTGYACAIPSIYSARSIESPRKRFLTMLASPLMSCSARLPVYGLLVAAVIPANKVLGGLFGLQGLVFFFIYFFGMFVALILTKLFSKSKVIDQKDTPFILEMPPYRVPALGPLLRNAFNRSMYFIKRAGFIIFMVTVVIWFLGYFPNGAGHLESSYLAVLGHVIEPIFQPLGMDWKFGVAILTSFLAREVFVGTLGTLFGIEAADDNTDGLIEQLHASGLSVATGVALLVFYTIALQCVATVAVLKRELGSSAWAVGLFIFYGILAYVLSAIAYFAVVTFL